MILIYKEFLREAMRKQSLFEAGGNEAILRFFIPAEKQPYS